jgi:hypothetical protein
VHTPPITLHAMLFAGLGAALALVLGGPGGCWIALRALRQRVDAHDDELDSFSRRVSRREGMAGRERQREQGSKLEQEAERLLAQLELGKVPRKNERELLASLPDQVFGPRGRRDEEA